MKSTWTVKGTLKVEHEFAEMIEAFGAVTPLAGVEVKVSARERIFGVWGPWNSWGTTRTNADGAFSIAEEKDQSKRQFKAARATRTSSPRTSLPRTTSWPVPVRF